MYVCVCVGGLVRGGTCMCAYVIDGMHVGYERLGLVARPHLFPKVCIIEDNLHPMGIHIKPDASR